MRVNQEYRKGGYFWLPNTPDEKVPGTLHISNGGDIKLEIIGLLDNSIEALNGMDSFDRVIGLIEDDGYVTLDNCFYKTKTMSFGGRVAKSIVIANKVLSGVSYDEEEKLTFNTFSFKADGLDEWLGMSGITVVYSNDYKSAEIKYTAQKELIYQLDNGLKLHVVFSYTLPMANKHTSEVKIKQKAYFKLVSEPEIELSEFIMCAHKIINFMSFAIDTTVAISDISATSNSVTVQSPPA